MSRLINICSFFLILMLISNNLFGQHILYQENFEDSASFWWNDYDSYEIINDVGNHVLKCTGSPAFDLGQNWYDYKFSFHSKILSGGAVVYYRICNEGRYALYIDSDGFDLTRFKGGIDSSFQRINVNVGNNVWHVFTLDVFLNNIKVYMDNDLYIDCFDPKLYKTGDVSLGIYEGTTYYDNLKIETNRTIPIQTSSWIKTGGPIGGMGYDVRIHPVNHDIMFVTDVWAGIYKSYDGGETWHEKNTGISSRLTPTNENRFGPSGDAVPIFCATIDPSNPDIVWCGTQNYTGIFKSVDCGETWTEKSNGIPDGLGLTFRSFAVDPTNSDIVYIGCEAANFVDEDAVTGKIYKTIDGGENWFEVLDSKSLVRIILIDPRDTNVLYASTGIMDRGSIQEEGVWKSEDAGNTWFHANNGILSNALTVEGLDFDPSNPDILYASTGRWSGFNRGEDTHYGAIYKTYDGGENWTTLLKRPVGKIFVPMYLAVSPSDPNIVYVTNTDDQESRIENAIFRTFDGGATWEHFDLNTEGIRAGVPISVAVHPTKPNIVFVNYYGGGVVKSIDYGKTWKNSSNGYTGAQIYDLTIDSKNPSLIYCTNRVGPFKSFDGGDTWMGIGYGTTKDAAEWGAIEINPMNSNEVLAGRGMGNHIHKTTDGGYNWYDVLEVPPKHEGDSGIITSISWSKSDQNIVFASLYVRSNPLMNTDSIGHGVYKSEDKGETWKPMNNGIENTKKNALTVEVHPSNPNIIFASIEGVGIYKSEDGGNSWNLKNNGISNYHIKTFAFDPKNPNIIYAGIENGGIFKSIDLGENWKQISVGMDPEASIRSIIINPQNSQELFAHDWFTGVYWSLDSGESWYRMNDGLFTKAGQSLAISDDGSTLYAGTNGGGVFRLVRENSGPSITNVFPDTLSLISVEQGGTRSFLVNVHDLNHDPITYIWKLDNAIISNAINDNYSLSSSELAAGQHVLMVSITDGTYIKKIKWQVQVVQSEPPKVSLDYPNGGEIIPAYETKEILWQATDNVEVAGIDIKYSLNAGQNWISIVDSITNTGSYVWEVPYTPSEKCKLKIVAYDVVDNVSEAISNNHFTIPSLLVTNISPPQYKTGYLNVGDECYIDQDYIITNIPQELTNLFWIKTVNQDKNSTGFDFLTFHVNEPVIVYVAYDPWIPTLPNWLSSWIKLNESIGRSDHDPYPVYYKEFNDTTISLGGNYGDNSSSMYFVLVKSKTTTNVEGSPFEKIPKNNYLFHNYPNPFNSTTTIRFAVKSAGIVTINIYDILGRKIETLVNEKYNAGFHKLIFEATRLSSGLYFYEIEMKEFRDIKKGLLLK